MDDRVRYRHRPIPAVAWVILAVVTVTLGGLMWRHDPRNAPIMLALLVTLAGITALTLFSINLYGRLRITDSELRIGRDRIPLSTIDPWSVRGPGEEQVPGKAVGGGYAVPLGMKGVGMMVDGQGPVVIPTREPERLSAALRQALLREGGETPRHRP
ncbi:hypothetical protein BJF86_01975 [Serinicoccus sp. CNJ-927]|uniref:DUF3093 family protein n=1 Tax=Serinicoccus sp. CNJ-927 TaxID=1904970 RepID=UPI00095CCC92|nr:DUF3093 family protein [Serinicoccus sp. CNJ-927]OLT41808.1 hypothetical protein BJF86_01975 [Serinicoccus sp. CNJ-927]